MKKCNQLLRNTLRQNDIPYWQLAQSMGVCENTIVRWFRIPLSTEQTENIQAAINRIILLRNGGTENADSAS